ncbi:MAG: SBBP repeat-containing protein [Phycisphaerales bacterium]
MATSISCRACAMAVSVMFWACSDAHAENPYPVEWIAQIGTAYNDTASAVAVDGFASAYIAGSTTGSLGGINAGDYDAYLTKFDAAGAELWSRQLGTSSIELGSSLAIDDEGNIYFAGQTQGNLYGINAGKYDVFVTKYNPSGVALWSRQFGTVEDDRATALTLDGSGNVYLGGIRGYTIGSPGGAGNFNDGFLMKLNPSGDQLWSKQIVSAKDDEVRSVAVDDAGNIFISGTTRGDLAAPNAGSTDAFLMKFDPSGTELWSRQVGTSSSDFAPSVAVDGAGNAFITGYSTGNFGGPNQGYFDAYLMKYDSSGSTQWVRRFGGSYVDESYSVSVDAAGSVFISGRTDSGLGAVDPDDMDAFIVKLDTAGNQLWSELISSPGTDESYAITVDETGNLYMTGRTNNQLGGINKGGIDAFLVKFTVPEPASITLVVLNGLWLSLRRPRAAS